MAATEGEAPTAHRDLVLGIISRFVYSSGPPCRADATTVELTRFSSLYKSENFSDLTIKLDNRTWKVHKLVVCSQSTFFAHACAGDWKEAREGVVTLHEQDVPSVEAMIEYLYTGTYSMPEKPYTTTTFDRNIFQLADQYDMPVLAKLAADRIMLIVSQEWASFPVLAEMVEYLCEDGPVNALTQGMRRELVKICVDNEVNLLHDPNNDAFREAIRTAPLFAIEFSKAVVAKTEKEHEVSAARSERLLTAKLRAMQATFEASCESAIVPEGQARMRCTAASCRKHFVAEQPPERKFCPECGKATVVLAERTLKADVVLEVARFRASKLKDYEGGVLPFEEIADFDVRVGIAGRH
ncbi:uncharacterized protein RCC_10619 [Ramularia collo-cygni]|uniref:BTB domain-containing protein n=1 Tax=Ramularia collo-cygni TaxID=112498 RepID=A0A2D3VK82_9PEZI|nr:uncharacterized protein RCC_10619 [Ramularia collo-cygni]CZT24891.1 uncharacterized protein RCC_10619 [Ramularia collo-cygni]